MIDLKIQRNILRSKDKKLVNKTKKHWITNNEVLWTWPNDNDNWKLVVRKCIMRTRYGLPFKPEFDRPLDWIEKDW